MRKRLATTIAAASLLGALLGAAPASADYGLKDLDLTILDAGGQPDLRAGSHPYGWTTGFGTNTEEVEVEKEGGGFETVELPEGDPRDVLFEFEPGLIANPFAASRCSSADFSQSGGDPCAPSSVVGNINVVYGFGRPEFDQTLPVFNLEPPPGVALRLGFKVSIFSLPVVVDAGIVPHPPYNGYAASTNITQGAHFYSAALTVWGNPASSIHDTERCQFAASCAAGLPERAFFTVPRNCEGPLETHVETRSWQEPTKWLSYDLETNDGAEPPSPLSTTGCASVPFNPTIDAQPTTDRAESPSGLVFDLDIDHPGIGNPDGIAHSDIKKTVVTLPEGVTINPSQAEGLLGCTPGQFDGESADSGPGAGCPEASKIGNVEVETPLVEDEVFKGALYVAQPFDNPFDSLIALYMTVKSARYGVNVGLAGKVEPDPVTGQLLTTFDDLPQLPFSHFRLKFREGGRSPLITPPTCGSYETVALFTPWANPSTPYRTTSSFEVTKGVGGGACPTGGQPFEPGFAAGAVNNNGGSFSPFNMRLTRRDGDQDLTRFDATLPKGVLAKLAGVTRCPDAQIALAKEKTGKAELRSPACPANSKIGTVKAGAGVGSQLVYVDGSVYLAGPFDGAPLSVVGVVPAVAGPFDVGTVVTRQALQIDPVSGVASVDGESSDPIPHILAGIPLRVRDIQVYVDRSGFTLNPTSCDPFATGADIWGGGANVFSTLDDSPVARSARFQAANCQRLAFKPRIRLQLFGKTRRGAYQGVRAVVRPRPGHANIAGSVVRFPRSAFVAQEHLRNICTRVQFAAEACPQASVYGRAVAWSPLLDFPLRGKVHLRSSDNELPDLVADLRGPADTPIKIEVAVRNDSARGALRNTVQSVPDAPVTYFRLQTFGGNKGLIVNSRDICKGRNLARTVFRGQNGKRVAQSTPVFNRRCKRQRKAKRKARGRVARIARASAVR